MKSKIKSITLFTLFVVFSSTATVCQEWGWDWANSISNEGPDTWLVVEECDFMGNIYSICSYDTLMLMPDTAFHHPEQYPGNYSNSAVLIHDKNGGFIKALDLYTLPGEYIFNPKARTDQELNLYFSCHFSTRMFVQDTVINHCNTPYPYLPDGLIMKLNSDLDIVWAKQIGGTLSDNVIELVCSDNGDLFILSEQIAGTQCPTTVSFFGQDTVYSDHDFSSISKLDTDGNMLWRNDFHGGLTSARLIQGKDGNLYFWGKSITDIVFEGDTIVKPVNPESWFASFFATISNDGNVAELQFFDFPIFPYQMEVNATGEFHVSGSFWYPLIIGQDTIFVPEDESYGFIGKFDASFQPEWYHVIYKNDNQQLGIAQLELYDGNLIFMQGSNDDYQLADTVLSNGSGYEAFFGELNESGGLEYIARTETTHDLNPARLILDNCSNPIISGSYKGISYMGKDTLDSFLNSISDGFVSKLIRVEPVPIDLGLDTLVCGEFTIQGPEGYQFYSWNDSLTNQNWLTVSQSGSYCFACTDELGCWLYDTIHIDIYPAIEINLGPDTSIKVIDTLVFSISGQYESYIWSDGTTSNTIIIMGNEYGLGTFPIWVEVTDGPCIVTDTIYLTVNSEFGINGITNNGIKIFPNPFNEDLTIELRPDYQQIEIYDVNGISVFATDIVGSNNPTIQISLWRLGRGVYVLKVKSLEYDLIRKIVKF